MGSTIQASPDREQSTGDGGKKSGGSTSFRPDIAGLRALAVILVLLSHYEIAGFSAGFVGVDVFFVISGYLITGLLAAEYERNAENENGLGWISITGFYLRRVRRILPAALLVLFVTSLIAYLTLNAIAAKQVLVDSLWASIFASNLNFMHQATDYWAQGVAVSPVLHYWSLAVEEQFYFVWPLLFVAATSVHGMLIRGRVATWVHRLLFAISTITTVSFFWMIYSFRIEPNVAYFSSLTRAWELGVGAIAVLILRLVKGRKTGSPIIWASSGLALVTLSMFVVTSRNFGYTLVLPVLGTVLLLLAGSSHFSGGLSNPISSALSIRPMVFVGAISYSLYLWHWPVLVLGRKLGFFTSGPSIVGAVVVSFVLAVATYKFVEQPFLRIVIPDSFSTSRLSAPVALLLCGSVLTGLVVLTNANFLTGGSESGIESIDMVIPVGLPANQAGMNVELPYAQQLKAWKSEIANGQKIRQIPSSMYGSFANMTHANLPKNWRAASPKHLAYIYGDSMANFGSPLLYNSLPLDTWSIKVRSDPGADGNFCPVGDKEMLVSWKVTDTTGKWADCERIQKETLQEMSVYRPDLVVLIDTRISAYGSNAPEIVNPSNENYMAWNSIVAKVKKYAKSVVVVGIYPHLPQRFVDCVDRAGEIAVGCEGDLLSINHLRAMQKGAVTAAGGTYLDTSDWLCFEGSCPPIIGSHFVYYDAYHWTSDIAAQLSKLFKSELVSLKAWPA